MAGLLGAMPVARITAPPAMATARRFHSTANMPMTCESQGASTD